MRSTGKIIVVLLIAGLLFVPLRGAAVAGTTQTYIILYKGQAVPADAAATVTRAGGTFVYSYEAIGVVIARSDDSLFRENLLRDTRIENAASTASFGVKSRDVETLGVTGPPPGNLPNTPVPFSDTLTGLQWDMRQISVPDAHGITRGSPAVVVGDLDTGLDFTHPDIAPNYDAANSINCESGAPAPLLPGNDQNGHGTHTAGTIAAAANGIGIVGVAPNVKIAAIKTSNDAGFFFPEMVVCAFMWAGAQRLDVTNNSYFADPWLFNCRNDPVQRAIWKAEQRAIRYALRQGVTVVAATGNFSDDLAHPTRDVISPDFPPGSEEEREIRNSCVVVPVEIAGVIGVNANGNRGLKSFYSSYGSGVTDVVAPGGDSILQVTAQAPNGRVLSTWPAALPCTRSVFDPSGAKYCYLQGTSMASPHVAGVAALIISRFGNSGLPNGQMRPGAVQAMLTRTADPMACPPDLSIYAPFPSVSNGAAQACQGGAGYNSFNGSGQVNALEAVR